MRRTQQINSRDKPRGIWRKLLRKLYYRRTLIYLSHELKNGHRQIKPTSRFDIKRFETSDLCACETYLEKYIADFKNFLTLGYVGFVGIEKQTGAAVGTVWYARQTFRDTFYGCHIDLADNEVFQMAGEVAKPFRNSLITANVLFYAWDYWMTQTGVDRIVTLIQDDNLPSLKLTINTGFQEQGRFIVIHRFPGFRLYQYKTYTDERFNHLRKPFRFSTRKARI
jgi:hypothetical protein